MLQTFKLVNNNVYHRSILSTSAVWLFDASVSSQTYTFQGDKRNLLLFITKDQLRRCLYCLKVVSRDAAVYTCLVCSADEKFIADSKGITHHLKEVHNLRLYICDMCGQEFFKRSELSAHLDEHISNEERDFQCEVCNRIFSNLRLYRVHKRMHYPQHKNWTCDQCGKRYL